MKTMRQRAHTVGLEWIPKRGEVCIRLMHWTEGVRVVRLRPDDCEFRSLWEAERKLVLAEKIAACLSAPDRAEGERNLALLVVQESRRVRFLDQLIQAVRRVVAPPVPA